MKYLRQVTLILFLILFSLTGCNAYDSIKKENEIEYIDYNIEDYRTISIGNKKITFPCSYRDFKKLGYYLEDENELLKPVSDIPQKLVTDKNGNQMYIRLVNHSTKEVRASACKVYGLSIDCRNTSDEIEYIGVTPGTSKDKARTALKTSPVKECINTLENGYTTDLWYLISNDTSYLRKGKINITYQDNKMCSMTINCLDFN